MIINNYCLNDSEFEKMIINFLFFINFSKNYKILNKDLTEFIINYLYSFNYNIKKLNNKTYELINSNLLNNKIAVNLNNIRCQVNFTSIYSFDPSVTLVLYLDEYISIFQEINKELNNKIKKYFLLQNENIKYNSFIHKNTIVIYLDYYQIQKIKDDTINTNFNSKNIKLIEVVNRILNLDVLDICLNCRVILNYLKNYNRNIYVKWTLDYIENCILLN